MMSKFAYFGTPYVASDTLAYLLEKGFTPAVVVSSPDAKQGRGMQLTPSLTSQLTLEKGLPLLRPEVLDAAFMEELASYGCEYAIVVAFGKIFPLELIESFPKGVLNIHYSLLPKYRGASPVESALLNGEEVTGVSIQRMVRKMDAGPLLASKEVAIQPEETTRELRPRLVQEGAELLVSVLPSFEDGSATETEQDETAATFAKKITKEEGCLDLAGNAEDNWDKYRAFAESPGTYFFENKNGVQVRVKIKTAKYENGFFVPLRVVPEGKKETDYTP